MATEHHAKDLACVGHTTVANSSEVEWCSAGMQALVVDITGDKNELKCGTQLGHSVSIALYP